MIEFLKDWRIYKVGDTTDAISGGVADVLFRGKIARPVVSVPVSVGAESNVENEGGSEAAKPATRIRRRN